MTDNDNKNLLIKGKLRNGKYVYKCSCCGNEFEREKEETKENPMCTNCFMETVRYLDRKLFM